MISLLIPLYNEDQILRKNVQLVHSYLEEQNISHEIIAVSNGSIDRTAEIGRDMANEFSWFKFYELPEASPGRAFKKAVLEAKSELLVTLDADISSDLVFLVYANNLLKYGDILVGSKVLGSQRRSIIRMLGSQFYILLSQILFGLTISDYSMGCKAYRRSELLPILSYLDDWTGFTLEIIISFHLRGKKILQLGVDCVDKRKSKFNLLHEAYYRYIHLFTCWRLKKQNKSWLNKVK